MPRAGELWRAVAPWDLLIAAWLSLSTGLFLFRTFLTDYSLWLCTLALVLSVLAGIRLRAPAPTSADGPLTRRTVPVLAAGVVMAAIVPPIIYGTGRLVTAATACVLVSCVVTATIALDPSARARRAYGALVVVLMTAAGLLVVHASPAPLIDVWVLLTQGADRVVDGGNLYTSCWVDNTDPLTTCVYPYLPWTTVVQVPFEVVFGDVRVAYLAAMALSSLLVYRLAGPSRGPLLAALLLLQPKYLFLVEQAWTEPLLLAGLAVMVWGALSGRDGWAVVGLAFALATKQQLVIVLPLALWWPAFGPRRTAYAVGLAAVAVAPFALRDPGAFKADVFDFHLHLPNRLDSLSFFGLATRHDLTPPFVVVALATAAGLLLALAVMPRTGAGFVAGSAVTLLVFNLTNKASFFNHYSLVVWLFVLALAAAEWERREPPTTAG